MADSKLLSNGKTHRNQISAGTSFSSQPSRAGYPARFAQRMLLPISTTHSGVTYIIVCDTFDICASTEKTTFSSDHGEDGIWVIIEKAKCGDGVLDEVAAKGVQCFGSVEL